MIGIASLFSKLFFAVRLDLTELQSVRLDLAKPTTEKPLKNDTTEKPLKNELFDQNLNPKNN